MHRPPHNVVTFVWIAIGAGCIVAALYDVFHTLFHPAGRGAISDWIAELVWRSIRRISLRKPNRITLAGPLAIVAVMAAWIALVVFGFAFVYKPFIATQYAVAPGLDPAQHKTFFDAFNVSLGGLITLGGDINAKSRVLRLLLGIEAVFGFGFLTASVSWLLSIYPILERRRTVGHEATLLHHAEQETGAPLLSLPATEAQQVLWGLAGEIASLRNDLTQFPITFYFHSGESHSGFPGALLYLSDMAQRGSRRDMPPSIRLAAVALGGAIDDYLEYVAETFLQIPLHDKPAILLRYAEEQLRQPMRMDVRPLRRAG
jgi:hypothetical protein